MQVIEKKSKIMTIERIKKARVEFRMCTCLGEMNFEEMDQFVYLGALITNKYEEVREIDAKLIKTNRIADNLNYLLMAKQLSRTTKFRLYETVMRPTG